jgi:hypothetical protein
MGLYGLAAVAQYFVANLGESWPRVARTVILSVALLLGIVWAVVAGEPALGLMLSFLTFAAWATLRQMD